MMESWQQQEPSLKSVPVTLRLKDAASATVEGYRLIVKANGKTVRLVVHADPSYPQFLTGASVQWTATNPKSGLRVCGSFYRHKRSEA